MSNKIQHTRTTQAPVQAKKAVQASKATTQQPEVKKPEADQVQLSEAVQKEQQKRQLSMDQLKKDPAAYQAYERLSAEQREKYSQLSVKTMKDGDVDANPRLRELLTNGKLTQVDKDNVSTLDHLDKLSNSPRNPKLDQQQVLNETVDQIADPGKIHQSGRGTCAPTSMEYRLASESPAEYARLAEGLTSSEGQLVARDGSTLKTNQSSLTADNTDRSSVSRVIQSSLMDHVAPEGQRYDNNVPQMKDGKQVGTGGFVQNSDGKQVGDGMSDEQMKQTWKTLSGENPDAVSLNDKSSEFERQITRDRIERDLAEGRKVNVSLEWQAPGGEHGRHALTVERQDEEYVYLRNPWGKDEQGQKDSADRLLVDNEGMIKMKKEDFYKRVTLSQTREEGTLETVYQQHKAGVQVVGNSLSRGFDRLRQAYNQQAEWQQSNPWLAGINAVA